MNLSVNNNSVNLYTQSVLKNLVRTRHPNFSLRFPIGNSKELDIPIFNISHIEPFGSLSELYMIQGNRKSIKIADNIGNCEKRLAEYAFIRVHRSYLVNCSCIKNIESGKNCKIILFSDLEIPISRRRMKTFKTLFDILGFSCAEDPVA